MKFLPSSTGPQMTFLVGLLCGAAAFAQSPRFSRLPYASTTTPNDEDDYRPRVVGDFDGDGDLDLAGPRGFLINDGQAKFAAGPPPAAVTTFAANAIPVAGDFDGDGKAELLVVGVPPVPSSRWHADPTGAAIQLPLAIPPLSTSGSVNAAKSDDVDGDGDLDVLILGSGGSGAAGTLFSIVYLALNQGGGNFVAGTPLAPGAPFYGLTIGDFDGDGDSDWLGYDPAVVGAPNRRIAWNGGGGGFTLSPYFGGSGIPTVFAVADFTGDALADVALGRPGSPAATVNPAFDELLVNLGGGAFASFPGAFPSGPTSLRVFDFDLDGAPDLLRESRPGVAAVHQLTATGIVAVPFSETASIHVAGDFDGDGDSDALRFEAVGELRLRLAAPGGLVDCSDGPFTSFNASQVAVADLDLDGDVDFAGLQFGAANVLTWEVLNQTAPGRFEPEYGVVSATVAGSVASDVTTATADLDGDGLDEIVVAGVTNVPQCTLRIGKRLPNGQIQTTVVGAAPGAPRKVLTFDADADGDLDVVVVGDTPGAFAPFLLTEHTRLYLNQGGLIFTSIALGTPHYGADIAAIDLDLDGDLDLLQANTSLAGAAEPTTVFTNQGGGAFVQSTFSPSTVARSVAVGDLDLDGTTDVMLGAVPFFRTPGGFSAGPPAPFVNGYVGYGDLADVTGDGLLDRVAPGGFTPGLGAAGFGAYEEMRPWSFSFAAQTFVAQNRVRALDVDRDGDLDVVDRVGRVFWNLTRHLEVARVPALGRVAALDVYGAPFEPFGLFLSLTSAAPVALPPFGTLFIDAPSAVAAYVAAFDANGRSTLSALIPNAPSLDGTTIYWQCLHFGQARLGTAQLTTLRNL